MVNFPRRQCSVGTEGHDFRSSHITGGREHAAQAKEIEKEGVVEVRKDTRKVSAQRRRWTRFQQGDSVRQHCRLLRDPIPGARNVLALQPRDIASDFRGQSFQWCCGWASGWWTDESGGAETLLTSCV